MKGKLVLHNDMTGCKYDVSYIGKKDRCTYEILVDINEFNDFHDVISNYSELESSIKISSDLVNELDELNLDGEKDFFAKCINNAKELIDNVDEIEILLSLDDALEYIKSNDELKNKEVILVNGIDLNIDTIYKIKKSNVNTDNLYFLIEYNDKKISFSEYEKTVIAITQIADTIKNLNLSPLEIIMFTYDLVRKRIYHEEGKDADYTNSRDLSKALFGDDIVCVGYIRIFNAILRQLGLNPMEVDLKNTKKNSGHVGCVIHVIDPKYHVDGVFYFDPTWDSKNNINDKEYLRWYTFFAVSKRRINEIDKLKNYVDLNFPDYYDEIIFEFEKEYKEKGLNKISKSLIRSVNYMSYLVTGERLITPINLCCNKINIDDVMNKLINVVDYYNKNIDAETFLNVLYNVRCAQQKLFGDDYKFTKEDYYQTLIASRWVFDNPKTRLLRALLGKEFDVDNESKRERFNEFCEENNIMDEVDLVKRKIYKK